MLFFFLTSSLPWASSNTYLLIFSRLISVFLVVLNGRVIFCSHPFMKRTFSLQSLIWSCSSAFLPIAFSSVPEKKDSRSPWFHHLTLESKDSRYVPVTQLLCRSRSRSENLKHSAHLLKDCSAQQRGRGDVVGLNEVTCLLWIIYKIHQCAVFRQIEWFSFHRFGSCCTKI